MSFDGNNMNPNLNMMSQMMNNMNNPMMFNMNNPLMNNMNNPMMNNMNIPMMNNMNNSMMNNMNNPMMCNMNNPMMCNMNNPMMNNMNNPMVNNMNNPMMNNNQLLMNNQVMMNQMNAMAPMPMQIMAEQQPNSFINNNNDFTPLSQNTELTLQFCNTSDENKTISVPCQNFDKLSDVVARYWSKIGVKNPPVAKYVCNAKNLDLNLTVEGANLHGGCVIQVVQTEGIRGA